MKTLTKNNINQVAAEIFAILESERGCHGLRIMHSDFADFDIKEGDDLKPSHDWDFDNDQSFDDQYLDGVSTIAISEQLSCTTDENIESVADTIKHCIDTYGQSSDTKLVLVSGNDMGVGSDEGEIVIDGYANKIYSIDMD